MDLLRTPHYPPPGTPNAQQHQIILHLEPTTPSNATIAATLSTSITMKLLLSALTSAPSETPVAKRQSVLDGAVKRLKYSVAASFANALAPTGPRRSSYSAASDATTTAASAPNAAPSNAAPSNAASYAVPIDSPRAVATPRGRRPRGASANVVTGTAGVTTRARGSSATRARGSSVPSRRAGHARARDDANAFTPRRGAKNKQQRTTPASSASVDINRWLLPDRIDAEASQPPLFAYARPTTEFLGWRRLHLDEIVQVKEGMKLILIIPSDRRGEDQR